MEQKMLDFLAKELGEYYGDIIELEWDMSVGKFCKAFVRCDRDGCLYCEI